MATMGLVLFALGPGAATAAAAAGNTAGTDSLDVSVSQAGNAGPTVTVTDNDTAVENASVTVDALDNGTYEAAGETYTTDANGTVTLPEPEENVSVEVTATTGNATGSTTADLTVAGENETASFGDRVSAFVQSLLSGNATGIGQQVAEFVTENNPGNAPEWAGPPEDGERGPPEDGERGPPADAGQDDNETDEDDSDDERRGPPADAGPPEDSDDANETEEDSDEVETEEDEETDDANETEEDEETEDDDESDEETDDDDDRGGPPEQARGNGN